MQHVVAVVGGEHGLFRGHAHDVAERMLLPLDHAHAFGVENHIPVAVRGHGDQGRVRRRAQQFLEERQLAGQRLFAQGLARRGQHGHGDQIDGGHRGRGVDADNHGVRQILDGLAHPTGGRIVRRGGSAPLRMMFLQQRIQGNGLSQINVHGAEFAAQNRRRGLDEPEHAFLFLPLARELADVSSALDDPLVAEVHRHEYHRAPRIADEAAHRHRQHAGARRQQAAGAAATALHEVFERMPARHHESQIIHEDRGVQRIALEGSP